MTFEHYQAQAEQLAISLVAQGSPLRHHEILLSVAKEHGASSWQELLERKSFGRRVLERLGVPAQPRQRFVTHSAVLYGSSSLQHMRFGVTRDKGDYFSIDDSLVRRHTLVLGLQGVGITVLHKYLLFQQMARGGGFLYLDQYEDLPLQDELKLFAHKSRTPFELVDVHVGESTDFHLQQAIQDRKGLYATLPILSAQQKCMPAVASLQEQLKQAIDLLSRLPKTEPEPCPFLIFIPCAHLFQDPNLAVLMARARAMNIAFIFTENHLDSLARLSKDTAETILQNTWNKVLFKHYRVGELLVAYGSEVANMGNSQRMGEILVSLGLGEAWMITGNIGGHLHIPMVLPDKVMPSRATK